MSLILIIFFFIVGLFFLRVFKTLETSYSLFLLFFIFSFIYNVSIPVEMIFFNDYRLEDMVVKRQTISLILLLSAQSILGFGLGLYFSGFRFRLKELFQNLKKEPFPKSLLFLFFTSILIFVLYYYDEIKLSATSYTGNVKATALNPGYAYLKEILFFSICLIQLFISINYKVKFRYAILFTLPLILLGIITSDKNPILLGILPLGIYYGKWSINKNVILDYFLTILLFISIPMTVLAFSQYRAIRKVDLNEYLEDNVFYRKIDSRGPFRVLIAETTSKEYSYGKTYINSLVYWIPRYIYPNRPLDPATEFAKKKMEDWKPGQGFGYSLLGESYKNFGIIGGFLQYFMIGLLFGFFGKLTKFIFRNCGSTYPLLLYMTWSYYNVILMHRGFFNLPSSYIRIFLPFFIFSILFDRIIYHNKKIVFKV